MALGSKSFHIICEKSLCFRLNLISLCGSENNLYFVPVLGIFFLFSLVIKSCVEHLLREDSVGWIVHCLQF